MFSPDEWWKDKNLILVTMKDFGIVQGFKPRTEKNTIRCNSFGSKKYAQKYEGEGLQVGCNFISYLKSMYTIKRPVENLNKPANKIFIIRQDWSRETCIITQPNSIRLNSSCWQHGGQCHPSTHNLIMSNERGGKYMKDMC